MFSYLSISVKYWWGGVRPRELAVFRQNLPVKLASTTPRQTQRIQKSHGGSRGFLITHPSGEIHRSGMGSPD